MCGLRRSLPRSTYISTGSGLSSSTCTGTSGSPQLALRRWFGAYAAASLTTASYETIRDAASPGEANKPAKTTTIPYRATLENLWMIEQVPAWAPTRNRLRRLAASPVHQLADPALTARLLGADTGALINNIDTGPPVPRDRHPPRSPLPVPRHPVGANLRPSRRSKRRTPTHPGRGTRNRPHRGTKRQPCRRPRNQTRRHRNQRRHPPPQMARPQHRRRPTRRRHHHHRETRLPTTRRHRNHPRRPTNSLTLQPAQSRRLQHPNTAKSGHHHSPTNPVRFTVQ